MWSHCTPFREHFQDPWNKIRSAKESCIVPCIRHEQGRICVETIKRLSRSARSERSRAALEISWKYLIGYEWSVARDFLRFSPVLILLIRISCDLPSYRDWSKVGSTERGHLFCVWETLSRWFEMCFQNVLAVLSLHAELTCGRVVSSGWWDVFRDVSKKEKYKPNMLIFLSNCKTN